MEIKERGGSSDGNHTGYHLITRYRKTIKDKGIECMQCLLCPNMCVIREGKSGLCGVRKNIAGKLYSTAYGYPASIHIDPIEKKPLYHFYPGKRILSFGTNGCNIFCKGCQNFEITRNAAASRTEYISPERIVDLAESNGSTMIAYTYNEPTIFFEYMIDIAKIARKRGIKNVLVSNGYINAAPLKELCRYIDAANIDIKGISERFCMEYSRAKLDPVLATIKTLHEKGIWLELTNLIIPGLNDSDEDVGKLCGWIVNNVGKDVPLHLSRFYPYFMASDIPITPKGTLLNAKKIAEDKGIKFVYAGNLGIQDDTYCPKCKTRLVIRDSDPKIIGIKDDMCARCRQKIPGIF